MSDLKWNDIYDSVVDVWRIGIFTGGREVQETTTMEELLGIGIPTLTAWVHDNDLQYIKIVSTNIGMIRTYQKRYKEKRHGNG
jgi:hypothetical protein